MDRPFDVVSEPGVLRPGETCWRLARADRAAVIIDAAAYFSHLKTAILSARHSILLIGWDFDTRVALDRDNPAPGIPNELGKLLNYAVRHNKHLRVYVLRWDLAFLKMPFRGTTPMFLLQWLAHRRLHFRLDSHHPSDACHHQKIAVIDDAVAFCGGIDVTTNRWDTPEHRDEEPRRVRPDGSRHGPWHDVTTAVDAEAARALGDLARDRWEKATGKRPQAPPGNQDRWPEDLKPVLHEVDVAIARTEPAYEAQPEVREIEALCLAAIASARRTIYLESQYFSAPRVAHALGSRLSEPNGPEIVVINPRRAEGWLEEEVMGSARAVLFRGLRARDVQKRLRFYTPLTAGGADIYVHAKVLVIDDTLLRIGSSNINNRSFGLDTECDLAVQGSPEDLATRRAILRVRDTLLAEHLGTDCERVQSVLREQGGSLVRMLDRLIRSSGKTLTPFDPPDLSDTERELAETHALDPRRPESMATTFVRVVRILDPPSGFALGGFALGLLALGAGALAAAGGAVAWRRRGS